MSIFADNTLLINACVRPESRTMRLAQRVLEHLGGKATELDLQREGLRPLTAETLRERDNILLRGALDDPMLCYARQFAAAEQIVVAAPYWDLSFPAAVKTYFEHVNVNRVTFSYGEDGRPVSHCHAKRLYYVVTAGGPILPPNHGYAYVKSSAETFYGIPEIECFSAELLDVMGMDVSEILGNAEAWIDKYFAR
ncbi:MAG: NAD(P)H-dependent oxidoreductase [Oscillospiraceae bacterium]|nr:NAD(P)H-dependent oxidoreductase [Oscillospiraceae bacterium]